MARKRHIEPATPPAPEPAPANANAAVFTIDELAVRWRVTRQTVSAAIKERQLKAFRVHGRLIRIHEADVLAYEQTHMVGGAA